MNEIKLNFDGIGYVTTAEFASEPGGPFPGLYNITTDDGREFRDLTSAQVSDVARRYNLDLRVVAK